jgi:hypothetical protein
MIESEIIQPDNTVARLKMLSYVKNGWKMTRFYWDAPAPEELKILAGDRIWPAGEDEKSVFIVKCIKQPGEKFYPEGGVVCISSGADRTFFMDAVIKHPALKKTKKKK